MKKIFVIFILAFFSMPAFATQVQQVEESGVRALLVEDHSLPIIAFRISFKSAGAAYDPEDKQGLAEVAASMLDEGAGNLDSDAYQTEMENIGARISANADYDNFFVSLKTLSKNQDKALQMLNLALTKPRYDKEALKRIKTQIISMLKRQEQDPAYIASRKFHQTYFKGHPYSHDVSGNEKSLNLIASKDLSAFAGENYVKNRLLISVSGDVTPERLKEILKQYFSGLQPGGQIKEIAEFTNYPTEKSVTKVNMDLPQSSAVFALKGVKRKDPDYYKAYALNYIVGGGEFESRLMKEAREKRGLAYSVYTELNAYQHAGIMQGGISTRSEKITESLKVVEDELKHIAKDGVTDEETQTAKKNLMLSLPLSLDSDERLASFLNIMQLYDLGIDYLDKRSEYIGQVTKEDINSMASRLLSGNVTMVEVGK